MLVEICSHIGRMQISSLFYFYYLDLDYSLQNSLGERILIVLIDVFKILQKHYCNNENAPGCPQSTSDHVFLFSIVSCWGESFPNFKLNRFRLGT